MITEKRMIFKVADKVLLAATLAAAVFVIAALATSGIGIHSFVSILFLTSFAVISVAVLALLFGGLGVLAHKLIAVAATLLPISLAMAVTRLMLPGLFLPVAVVLLLGFFLIVYARFAEATKLNAIAYPALHGAAAGISILLPVIFSVRNGWASPLLYLSTGVLLISVGGIALLFLNNGKKFLFFSEKLVSHVFTLLFLLTVLLIGIGTVSLFQ